MIRNGEEDFPAAEMEQTPSSHGESSLSSHSDVVNNDGGIMTARDAGSEPQELDRDSVTHWAAHVAGLLHFGVTFDSITVGGDECFPIDSPVSSDDGAVTARVALMGMSVDLFSNLLEANDELPAVTIVRGSIFGWREDVVGEVSWYQTDLLSAGVRVMAEAEWAYSFVLSNLDVIEKIADAIVLAGDRVEYRSLFDSFAGRTVEPSRESEDEAANTFAGHSLELELVDEAIRDSLE